MRIVDTDIKGVVCVELEEHRDDRGFFARQWCARELSDAGFTGRIAQANVCFNPRKGTLRGMHWQMAPHAETKFVRCTRGAIYDVVVDLRPDSCTRGGWIGRELTQDNRVMLCVPPLCAHGYLTLSDDAEILYLVSEFYAPAAECGIRYDDPRVAIRWPFEPVLVSDKDRAWPALGAVECKRDDGR